MVPMKIVALCPATNKRRLPLALLYLDAHVDLRLLETSLGREHAKQIGHTAMAI
jgi:arginase family enzyme